MEIFTEGNQVILRKYEPPCIFCGVANDVQVYKGRNICAKCRKTISEP
ncbi:AbrB family transcriptional regulator [gut metagenome]|uniref:AbrB family transcriptional regulator n=1 Tax=gut metagenome TaxID=749906 RepID=J9FQ30_9ZZZZ